MKEQWYINSAQKLWMSNTKESGGKEFQQLHLFEILKDCPTIVPKTEDVQKGNISNSLNTKIGQQITKKSLGRKATKKVKLELKDGYKMHRKKDIDCSVTTISTVSVEGFAKCAQSTAASQLHDRKIVSDSEIWEQELRLRRKIDKGMVDMYMKHGMKKKAKRYLLEMGSQELQTPIEVTFHTCNADKK